MSNLRIFAAGDFHNDSSLAKRLAEKVRKEDVDLIILNGDIVDEDQPHGVLGHFVANKKPLLMVGGNHDFHVTDFLAAAYKVKNLHGTYSIYGDVGFFGVGGANCGITQISDDEVYNLLKQGFDKIKHLKTKVLVSHVHPAETAMEKFSSFVQGSAGLRKAIDVFQPDLAIVGHVHEAEGIEERVGKTRVVNVGKSGKFFKI